MCQKKVSRSPASEKPHKVTLIFTWPVVTKMTEENETRQWRFSPKHVHKQALHVLDTQVLSHQRNSWQCHHKQESAAPCSFSSHGEVQLFLPLPTCPATRGQFPVMVFKGLYNITTCDYLILNWTSKLLVTVSIHITCFHYADGRGERGGG